MVQPPPPGSDASDDRVALGRQLRDLRLGREWTLQEVADRVGMSTASVSAYERGTRAISLRDLRRICDAYGLLVADFLGGVYPYGSREEPPDREPPPDGRRSRGR